jgi:gluconolactonase
LNLGSDIMQITKRDMLAAAGAAAASVALTRTALGGWEPNERYPDPAVQILDPNFAKYRVVQATVERIATGCRWNEGPVYFGDGRYLLWSDIPNNRIMRWDEESGRVSVYRKPSNFANGHTRDRQGRLVSCEHDTRRVTRTEYDGTITVLLDKFDGKPLNSPNDIVVKSDDSVWITDPPFGILGNYEGHVATPELPTNIYRVDKSGSVTVATAEVNRPNGLAFSPDEAKLYVVEAALTPRVIQVFDVVDGGTKLTNKRPFIAAEPDGTPDGFRVDVDGNLWCGWGMGNAQQDGVKIFDPAGKPIGFIALPERCANVCFGGVKRNRLFMAASHSVYSLYVNTQGVKGG